MFRVRFGTLNYFCKLVQDVKKVKFDRSLAMN